MCGIVGLIQYDDKDYMLKKKVFSQLLFLDTVRGEDGTGVFYSEEFNKPSEYYKRALAAPDFMQLKPYQDIVFNIEKLRFLIGHNRAATTGGKSTNDTHPFQEDHILLIHNGTLTDRIGLPNRSVDSNAIAAALTKDKNPIPILEQLNGAYALIWHDLESKCLYITKNAERPLHYVETNIGKLIASESGMLKWVIERNADLKQLKEVQEFEDYKLYKFWKTKKGKYFHNTTKYECKVKYSKSNSYSYNNSAYGGQTEYQKDQQNNFKAVRLKEGDYVKVEGTSFNAYNMNSIPPYGKLTCRIMEEYSPGVKVEFHLHSVLEADAKKRLGKTFFAKVSSVHKRYGDVVYKVALKFLNADEESKAKMGKVLALPAPKNKGTLTRLPNDQWVGKKDFLEFVKGGCTICGGSILWEDRHKLEWMESSDGTGIQPVCPGCDEDYGLSNYPASHTAIN